MNKYLTSLVISAALVGNVPSAFAADNVKRGNVLTPSGFCTVHQDGTKGVRFDAFSYTAFLAEYAADQIALAALIEQAKVEAEKNGGAPMTEMQIATLKAKIKKEAARLQRMRIDQGQAVLCR